METQKSQTKFRDFEISYAFLVCCKPRPRFKWPDYAWIFTDIGKPETFNSYCQANAINNAIFLQLTQ